MNSLTYALTGAEQLIADCPAFQARVGAGSSDAAKANIYYHEGTIADLSNPNNTLGLQRPFVILNILDAGYHQYSQDDGNNLAACGGILVQFQDNPGAGDAKAQLLDFAGFVGDVIDWVAANCGSDQPGGNPDPSITYFPFRMLQQMTPILRPDLAQRESEDFYWTDWLFSHNVNAG
jgi:hypothetical protein